MIIHLCLKTSGHEISSQFVDPNSQLAVVPAISNMCNEGYVQFVPSLFNFSWLDYFRSFYNWSFNHKIYIQIWNITEKGEW